MTQFVRLKSGGPDMTFTRHGDTFHCSWFVDDDYSEWDFDRSALVLVTLSEIPDGDEPPKIVSFNKRDAK